LSRISHLIDRSRRLPDGGRPPRTRVRKQAHHDRRRRMRFFEKARRDGDQLSRREAAMRRCGYGGGSRRNQGAGPYRMMCGENDEFYAIYK